MLWLLRRVALPFFCSAVLFGCRENTSPVVPPGELNVRFAFNNGDYASYDNWNLDEFGYIIPNTRFRDSWIVIDTAGRRAGLSPVSVVVDSIFRGVSANPDSLVRIDTLLFYTSPEGDLYQYGFLAALLKRREGTALKPQWDRIAAFSLGLSGFWTVGPVDSADSVYATMSSATTYIAVNFNGVQTALLAYTIEMTDPDLDVTLWLTNSPSAVVVERDESNDVALGRMKEINMVYTMLR